MIDVFVVAILLVYLTGGSSDTSRAETEIGLYFFLIYVILSMVASLSADKMLHKPYKSRRGRFHICPLFHIRP